MHSLIIAPESIGAANPAPSDVDKCARLSLDTNCTSRPCQIISREIELGKIAVVLNENEQKDCAIAKLS